MVHGGTCDQCLQGLRGRSQGAQQYAGKRPTTSSSRVFKFDPTLLNLTRDNDHDPIEPHDIVKKITQQGFAEGKELNYTPTFLLSVGTRKLALAEHLFHLAGNESLVPKTRRKSCSGI